MRSKNTGEAVLYMRFETPDISFEFKLGLTEPGRNSLYFIELKGLESII